MVTQPGRMQPYGGGNGDQLPDGTKLNSGRYEITRCLGQGGFGITYEAWDTTLNRRVAVKELFPDGCKRTGLAVHLPGQQGGQRFAQQQQRFLAEGHALASLSHPGIVRVYDWFAENHTAYLVLEFLEGQTLKELVNSHGPRRGREVEQILRDLCEPIQAIHNAGMMHRDLTPSNIMRLRNGDLRIIDFGGARAINAGALGTHSTLHTPNFASPEQQLPGATITPAADVYGLCATCYYLLTGSAPPDAAQRALGAALEMPRPEDVDASPELLEAIECGLELDISARPATVAKLLDVLEMSRRRRFSVAAALRRVLIAGVSVAAALRRVLIAGVSVAAALRRVLIAGVSVAAVVALGLFVWPKVSEDTARFLKPFLDRLASRIRPDAEADRPIKPPAPAAKPDTGMQETGPQVHKPAPADSAEALQPPPQKPPAGAIRVSTTPAGATVVVDGRERGRTAPDLLIPDLNPGDHVVEVRPPRGEDWKGVSRRRVRVRSERTVSVEIVFAPKAQAVYCDRDGDLVQPGQYCAKCGRFYDELVKHFRR